MRRLNIKLFLILMASSGLFLGTLFTVHAFQTGSIGRALLARADKAEQEQDLRQAAKYISRYLELRPEDVEQRAHLARLLSDDKLAITPKARAQAIFVIEQVLLKDPHYHDLRLKLVRLALAVDRTELAQQHLRPLQTELPDNGEVEHLLAQVAATQKKWTEAAAWERKAIKHAPQQIDSYVFLADVLRRQSGPDKDGSAAAEADRVMDDLVAKNPNSSAAHLARWQYCKQWAGLEGAHKTAADNVAAALRLAPDDAGVLLAAAELAQAEHQPERAREHLEHGKRACPHDPRMYRELALLELRQDHRAEALTCLRDGVRSLLGPSQAELLWTLGNVLIDGGEVAEARAVVAQMVKARASNVAVDYLNARLYIHDANWAAAARLLDRTRLQLANQPELSSQVDLLLAQCFEQLDDPAARLSALGRIISRDPASVSARLGLAGALALAGRLDEALEEYRQLMALPAAPPAGWIEMARIMVVRELQHTQQAGTDTLAPRKPKSPANWKRVEDILAKAEQANPGSVEVVILRAEVLLARGKKEAARQLLSDAAREQKDKVQLWSAQAALVMLTSDGKGIDEALRLLDEARKHAGDTLELRLVQTDFWARQGGPQAAKALAALAEGLDKFSPRDQSRVLGAIAVADYQIGETKEAARLWNRLAQEPHNKTDLRLRLLLFDLALQASDDAAMQRLVGELKQIEGDQGTLWRYAGAVRLIQRARQGDRAGLEEARTLLDQVVARRQEWPSVFVARADLDEINNHLEQAIANYRQAISLGERGPRVVRQLVQLLYKQQRYEEADQEVRRLQQQTTDQAELQRLRKLQVDISLLNEDRDRAVKLVEALSANSKDYRDHLWQGQVLAASGLRDDEAEKELRQAVTLCDTVPETWIALVQFLARQNRQADAVQVINRAAAKLPADKKSLALGVCYEMVGQTDRAATLYLQALAGKPADVSLIQAVAAFYLRAGKINEAEPQLRKLIDHQVEATPRDMAWARRNLALALAVRGDHLRALALVGLRLEGNGRIAENPIGKDDDASEELRVRAQVLAAQPWAEARKKAIAILDQLGTRRASLPDDQFLLAQLYDADGAWAKARDILRLLTGAARNAGYLTYYAQAALVHRDLAEAERCIGHLEQLEKTRRLDANALRSVELRTALLELKGQKEKALEQLRAHVQRPGAKPEEVFLLIGALRRQDKHAEALSLCTKARDTCPPEAVAQASVAIVRAGSMGEEACGPLETWLKEQCAKKPSSAQLWLHLADLQDVRGRYEDAEAYCRKSIEQDQRNPVALNNLAWLLTQRAGKAGEALPLINRAIEVAGPRGELLDTRASVYIALNQPDKAVKDLEAALVDGPTPTRYFHLAQAQRLANNSKQAVEALRKATSAGLTKAEQLHPVERAAFLKLKVELEQR
jgi:tetratricopeptide (TPR) repeat protein